ncbi:MAG: family 43 glycosylhydrolase, partial [Roseateles sp.]
PRRPRPGPGEPIGLRQPGMTAMELTERPTADASRGTPAARRRPDRGDGSFVNPVLPGDHPDPCALKDGEDYYLSCASQQFSPGAVIWHSRDLVNWTPVASALSAPVGSVRSVDLARHAGRYFLYVSVLRGPQTALLALHADDIRGPWSAPVDLQLPDCPHACHIVDEQGARHLLLNGLRRVRLSDDGLQALGAPVEIHAPCLASRPRAAGFVAGPRAFRRDDWFYLFNGSGGAGVNSMPHTLAVARSRSLAGPWEDCPFDPLHGAHTPSWTTGGTPCLVQGPEDQAWLLCHGHQAGHRTLGRQGLLQPLDWGRDGWFRLRPGALAQPLRKPRPQRPCPGLPGLSDDFSANRLGIQWRFLDAGPEELQRARYDAHGLCLAGKGSSLADCSPLTCVAVDASYEAELDFELIDDAQGGLALFQAPRGFVGLGIADGRMHTYSYGQQHRWMQHAVTGRRHRLRVTQLHHRISFDHAMDDGPWAPTAWLQDVSALHLNRCESAHGLRLALFSAGHGAIRLRHFSYRGLD